MCADVHQLHVRPGYLGIDGVRRGLRAHRQKTSSTVLTPKLATRESLRGLTKEINQQWNFMIMKI
jgi:hypothetical protein